MMPIPAGIVAGLFPSTQMQTTSEPFVWGQGGRRMTPDAIERERALASRQMQTDYSPIYSPWQGLARLSDNILGGLRYRDAERAEEDNLARSDAVARALTGGGTPSASAPPGAPQSSAPGGDMGLAMQVLGDPYASSGNRAIAKMLVDNAEFDRREKLKASNREQPEIVQLAQIANDASRPQWERDAARDRVEVLNNPEIVVPIEGRGTFIGGRKDLRTVLGGGSGGGPNVGDVVDGHRFLGGNPKDKGSWQPVSADDAPALAGAPQPPTIMQPWQYDGFVQSMGREAADAFLARNGITVGGR